MCYGLRAAVDTGYRYIHLESDNQILIRAVQGICSIPWQIHHMVQEIIALSKLCVTVTVSHTFREGNRVADWMAKLGLRSPSPVFLSSVYPRNLVSILVEDKLGRTLARRAI